jgi:hypothetical protein
MVKGNSSLIESLRSKLSMSKSWKLSMSTQRESSQTGYKKSLRKRKNEAEKEPIAIYYNKNFKTIIIIIY